MHGFAVLMIWLVPAPLWLAVLLTLLFMGSAGYYLRRDSLRMQQDSVVAFRLHDDCRCEFQTRAGDWHEADLLGTSFVAPYLAVLNLQPAGRRLARHLVILPDGVDAEDFRRLRVWLKWRCSSGA